MDHARGFPSIVIRESELLCRLAPSDRILIFPRNCPKLLRGVLLHGLSTVEDLFVVNTCIWRSIVIMVRAEHKSWYIPLRPWHSQIPTFLFLLPRLQHDCSSRRADDLHLISSQAAKFLIHSIFSSALFLFRSFLNLLTDLAIIDVPNQETNSDLYASLFCHEG